MQEYTQLSVENRHQIKVLLDTGYNQSKIAELKRNVANTSSTDKSYCLHTARQLKAQARR